MTLVNPIQKPVVLLSGFSRVLPAKGGIDLPVSGQNVPQDTQVKTREKPEANEAVRQTVNQLNEFAGRMKRNLLFRVDETLGLTVITVVNTETDEVIRQIPPEEALTLARHLENEMSAILDVQA